VVQVRGAAWSCGGTSNNQPWLTQHFTLVAPAGMTAVSRPVMLPCQQSAEALGGEGSCCKHTVLTHSCCLFCCHGYMSLPMSRLARALQSS
jgi:hypothetical protein